MTLLVTTISIFQFCSSAAPEYAYSGWIDPIKSLSEILNSSDFRDELIRWLDLGIKTLLAIIGLFALSFAHKWAGAMKRQAEIASQSLFTDRYTRAIEQVGSESESIRIGGMFALQEIMRENPKVYHWTVVEVLCAFIRRGSKRETVDDEIKSSDASTKKTPRLPHDIEVAVAILRERNTDNGIEDGRTLQLSGANLSGADLEHAMLDGANLKHANLQMANLMDSSFSKANLEHAMLGNTQLSGANFESASLVRTILSGATGSHVNFKSVIADRADLEGVEFENAIFSQASLLAANLLLSRLEKSNLEDTKLRFANLTKSRLMGTNCQNAKLEYANLEAANFDEANNLTWSQLRSAKSLVYATLPYYLKNTRTSNLTYSSAKNVTFAPKEALNGSQNPDMADMPNQRDRPNRKST